MAIRIQCPCGMSKNVPEEYVGKKAKCPKCGTVFRMEAVVAPPEAGILASATPEAVPAVATVPSMPPTVEEVATDERWESAKQQSEEAVRRAKEAAKAAAAITGKVAEGGAKWVWPWLGGALSVGWRWLFAPLRAVVRSIWKTLWLILSREGRQSLVVWLQRSRKEPLVGLWVAATNRHVWVLGATCLLVASAFVFWDRGSAAVDDGEMTSEGGNDALERLAALDEAYGQGTGDSSRPPSPEEILETVRRYAEMTGEGEGRGAAAGAVAAAGEGASSGPVDEAVTEEWIAVFEIATGQKWQGTAEQLNQIFLAGGIHGVKIDQSGWVIALSLTPQPLRDRFDVPGPQLGVESTEYAPTRNEDLLRLPELRHLVYLDLSQANPNLVTEAGLATLGQCQTLVGIILRGLPVNVQAMEQVGQLMNLKALHLSGSRVDDRGIEKLSGLVNLWELWVDHTRVTPQGLAALAPLKELKTIFALPNKYSLAECTTLLEKLQGPTQLQYLCDMDLALPMTMVVTSDLGLLMTQASEWRERGAEQYSEEMLMGSGQWQKNTPNLLLSRYVYAAYLGESARPVPNVWGPWAARCGIHISQVPWSSRFYWSRLADGAYISSGPPLERGGTFFDQLRSNWMRLGCSMGWQVERKGRSLWSLFGGKEEEPPPDPRHYGAVRRPAETESGPPKTIPYRGKDVLNYLRRSWTADMEILSLFHVVCQDEDLEYLEGLTSLKVLDLTGSNITGQGLAKLSDLKELRYLNLNGTHLCDEDLELVGKLFPQLQELYCFQTHVTAQGARRGESLMSLGKVIYRIDPRDTYHYGRYEEVMRFDVDKQTTSRGSFESRLQAYQGLKPQTCPVCAGSAGR